MAKQQYILCDVCHKDITDLNLRVSNGDGDVCADHLVDPRTVLEALHKLDVATDLVVSRSESKGKDRYAATLDHIVEGGGERGITPKVHPRDFLALRPQFNNEYWLKTSFKLPMTNGTLYVGGSIPELKAGDVYIDNFIAAEFAQIAVERYLNG